VWFLWDGEAVLVATGGKTQKARNAAARPRASVMIDARGRGALRGVAAVGRVTVIGGAEARDLNERVWAKYLTPRGLDDPRVGGAIRPHDDVTIRLTPESWRTWGTDADFGGAFETLSISYPLADLQKPPTLD
jgi:Pyridoxamine 5'-phosphate oxidase